MKKTNEGQLGDVIKAYLSHYKIDEKLLQTDLIENWEKIVGKTIAKFTENIYLKNNNLSLKVTNAVLKQELLYNKSQLIKIINDYFKINVVSSVQIY